MAYRKGNRYQNVLFPLSIEDYVEAEDPVRAYDAFIENINFKNLGIEIDENKEGNPEYDPNTMFKILLYAYSYGIRSSRKIERALYHNISFIWLSGGLKPDHKTISNFRKNNKKALKNLLKSSVSMCIKFDLIEGNILFVDGTKMRGNASIDKSWTKENGKKYIKKLDKKIDKLFSEIEAIDEEEYDKTSLVKMKKELSDKQNLKEKMEELIRELEVTGKPSINTVDKDCTRYKSRQGSHAGYNSQVVTDEKYGLIVNTDVVNENNDWNQFSSQIEQANKNLGKKCKVAVGDSGYSNVEELEKISDSQIKVIVPSQKQASESKGRKKEQNRFDKNNFKYDKEKNCYVCEEGEELIYYQINRKEKTRVYKIKDKATCLKCKHYGACTKSKEGRRIKVLFKERKINKYENIYKEKENKEIYNLRKEKAEIPFGHIKRNLGAGSFLLRGLESVKAEMSLLSTCFNITRMITILGGVNGLISKITI